MTKYLLLAATAAIGATFALSTPAKAGDVCELNGSGSLGGATAGGTGALACGINAKASGDWSTAVGFDATATAENGTAVGSDSSAAGAGSVALGQGAEADFDNSIVIDSSNGAATQVLANSTIAIGNVAVATKEDAISLGHNSLAGGAAAVAIGAGSNAIAGATVALGVNTNATKTGAVALGFDAQAQASDAVAVGNSATATGNGSVAIGGGSNAGADNSVAIGAGSTAQEANVVSVGSTGNERRVTNVAAGVNDTDAVNVGQLNAAIAGFSAFDPSGLQSQLDSLSFSLDSLSKDVHRYRHEAQRGTALAVAMSEAPMPSRDGGISYSLHGASYRGNMAVGASVKYRINRAAAIDFGVSSAGHKDTAVRLGVSGEF